MLIFAIVNRLIDLGSEIISTEELGAPNTYKEIMEILAKGNVVNKEQAENMNRLISKRNVFAHFYGDVTENDILDAISDLREVDGFLKIIKKRIEI